MIFFRENRNWRENELTIESACFIAARRGEVGELVLPSMSRSSSAHRVLKLNAGVVTPDALIPMQSARVSTTRSRCWGRKLAARFVASMNDCANAQI